MNKRNTNVNAAVTVAMLAGMCFGFAGNRSVRIGSVTPRMHTYVPMMVTSSPEEIEAWNAKIIRAPKRIKFGFQTHRQEKREHMSTLRATHRGAAA